MGADDDPPRSQGEAATALKRTLSLLKDWIGRRQGEWDEYKSASNPYEMVYTAPPGVARCDGGRRPPSSRAFYKLWEILAGDPGVRAVASSAAPGRYAYLGEAPGSFVEAVVSYRRARCPRPRAGPPDAHFGVSLVSDRGSVPCWKLQRAWMRQFGVTLYRGEDGTGDVTRMANLRGFVRECGGEGSCDMVTADGGFDFSSDFNEQEAQVAVLLAAELLAALRLLRPGGCAVVKVFDAFNPGTVELLAAFMGRFGRRDVRKPRTSRPANSERYVVCSGYEGRSAGLDARLEAVVSGGELAGLGATEALRAFVSRRNLEHGLAQAESILRALDAMDRGDPTPVEDLSGRWVAEFMPGHGQVTGPTEGRRPA